MSEELSKVGVVILAAGRGTRLNCVDEPKVMLPIGGRPIVSYIVDTLYALGFDREQICLVVGFQKEKVTDYFGDRISYAVQAEQKGTAHAAFVGMRALPEKYTQVLVLNGDDSAFYRAATLKDFILGHLKNRAVLSLLSVELSDPTLYGRVVRAGGKIMIIEKEYLTEEQKKIKETSTGTFCFQRAWFEKMFSTMPPLRKLGEYGLPTSLSVANDSGLPARVVKIADNSEWFGINTLSELNEAEKRKSS